MRDKKLELCPFCGGEADFVRTSKEIPFVDYKITVVFARCRNRDCWATSKELEYDPDIHKDGSEYDEVAELWNRRV
jgi:C4-type Zn-finger protein